MINFSVTLMDIISFSPEVNSTKTKALELVK